jgi:hypothetical protein
MRTPDIKLKGEELDDVYVAAIAGDMEAVHPMIQDVLQPQWNLGRVMP